MPKLLRSRWLLLAVAAVCFATLGVLRMLGSRFAAWEKQLVSRRTVEGCRLALESFYRDNARFPSESESLAVLAERGYIDWKNLADLWGTSLLYRIIDPQTVAVASLGADGAAGGTGFNEDLTATVKAPSKVTTELTFTSTQP